MRIRRAITAPTALQLIVAIATFFAFALVAPQARSQDRTAQHGHADPLFNLVTLSAHAEREVANDTLTAVLAADSEGDEPAILADKVNRAMGDALKLAQRYQSVKARSLNYQTWPVVDKARITRWRVRQELRLESRDFAQATELIGKLQSGAQVKLHLSSLSVSLSVSARKRVENALIAEAIAAFHERAAIVREAQKSTGYRVKNLQLDGGGANHPRTYAAPRAAMAGVSPAPPALEPGATSIQINVSGTIQLD